MTAQPQLLARVREVARAHLASSVASALGALPNDLNALAADAHSPAEARILDAAIAFVRAHRADIEAGFERSLLQIFDAKTHPGAARAAAPDPSISQLTLVDDDAIELEIALGRLVRKTVDELDGEQLAAAGARVGEVAVGRALEGAENPVGPETVLKAFKNACDVAPADGPVRMALVNSMQPHLALALRKLCPDVNELLLAAGVLPRVRHEIQRAPNTAAHARGPGVSGPQPAGPAGGQRSPLPPGMTLSQAMALKDLMPSATGSPIDVGAIIAALLEGGAANRQYGARMLANPQGSLFARVMATPASPEVVAQLSQLQGAAVADAAAGPGDLAAVVQHLAHVAKHPLDQLTGELVTVVFDFILNDRDLPEPVKAQLARLQIVALKAALLDRGFFARRDHPLRELLAAIVDAATDPDVDAEPGGRFVAELAGIVDECVQGFSEDLAVFARAREKLAALVGTFAEEGERRVAAVTPALVEQERIEDVRARARVEVARRLAAGAPKFVREFLTDVWTEAVTDAGAHDRAGTDGWDARLAVVDDLLWSVQPKRPEDQARFTALLPKLVPALGRGMSAVNLPPERRQAFLDELMRTHTEALQALRGKRPPAAPVAAPASVPPPILETGTFQAPALAADALLGLERGALVEFLDVDPPERAKLSWISPRRTLYVFSGRGGTHRQIAPGDLRAALRENRARLVQAGGSVERALAAVVGEAQAR